MVSSIDLQIAPYLQDSAFAREAVELVEAAHNLGTARWADMLRVWCVPYLFLNQEKDFASGDDPLILFKKRLMQLSSFLNNASEMQILSTFIDESNKSNLSIEEITGEHYGHLFAPFDAKSYFDEPKQLLSTRLERNSISLPNLNNSIILDAGCGGGRYTIAWSLLGAKETIGLDISPIGIETARKHVANSSINSVKFYEGNVLELPFENDTFDIVFSNGVLHHTIDWEKGVQELIRVMKPKGLGWLYLIERPGGIFWDMIDILRAILRTTPRVVARLTLELLGVPVNRIFYMLDHVMVPINIRLTPKEIENVLTNAGATAIRRLERGTDFDRIEQLYQQHPYASIKFGIGENRYVFSKE